MGEPYPSQTVFDNYSWIFDKYGKHSCYKRMQGHLFWTSMEKFPWSDRLIQIVDKATEGNWVFLTKPMADPYCYSGKAEWIRKHYPQFSNKLCIVAAPKMYFARDQYDILIDDKPSNIDEWKIAGGTPLLWQEISADFDPKGVDFVLDNLETFIKTVALQELIKKL